MSNNRYIRQTMLPEVGLEGQSVLKNSSVIIVGCGGLGIPAALYLTGAGIGTIHLIDFDQVELSNLHRQIIYKETDIGKNKALILADHLGSINSEITVVAYDEKLTEANALSLFNEADYVLDCTDNLHSRFLINDACVKLDKAFISASIYKFEGQLGLFNYNKGATYRCLYNNESKTEQIKSCVESGVIGTLPAQLGVLQANELIKVLLGLPGILTNKLMIFNILTYQTHFFSLSKNEALYEETKSKPLATRKLKTDQTDLEILDIDFPAFLNQKDLVFIDVREEFEEPQIRLNNLVKMPISEGLSKIDELNLDTSILCFCQVGARSLNVASNLRERGYKAFSLAGGIQSLIKHFPVKTTDEVNI